MVLDAYLRSRIQNFSLPDRYQSLYSKQRNAGKSQLNEFTLFNSVEDPGPGSGAFLTPGSGIRNRFFRIPDPGFRIPDPGFRIPDPGFRIPDPGSQTHLFEILVTIVWVKSSIFL
jgi:hypothetical protein